MKSGLKRGDGEPTRANNILTCYLKVTEDRIKSGIQMLEPPSLYFKSKIMSFTL